MTREHRASIRSLRSVATITIMLAGVANACGRGATGGGGNLGASGGTSANGIGGAPADGGASGSGGGTVGGAGGSGGPSLDGGAGGSGAGPDSGAGGSGGPSLDSGAGGGGGGTGHSFTTYFPLTESPISEGGKWVGGHTAGKACGGDYCWGDIQTGGGMAHGIDQPTEFGDSSAILMGSWRANQTATARVKAPVPAPSGGCCMEAEVRLRFSLSPGMATGYEIYCSVLSSNKYCHIASWGGPNGAYVNLDSPQWDNNNPDCPGFPVTGPQYLKNGDVLSGTVSGSNPVTITGYINSVPFMTVVDKGKCHFNPPNSGPYGPWSAGTPGFGFFGSALDTFGFTTFSASDS